MFTSAANLDAIKELANMCCYYRSWIANPTMIPEPMGNARSALVEIGNRAITLCEDIPFENEISYAILRSIKVDIPCDTHLIMRYLEIWSKL